MAKLESLGALERSRAPPAFLDEVLTALVTIGLATGLRLLLDVVFPHLVLYPLVFPALTIATLLAGWRCGLMVVVGCQAMIWYYLVPERNSFSFGNLNDAASLALATAAQLLLLWFVARYRAQAVALGKAMTRVTQRAETDRLIAEQEIALRASRQNLEAIYQASGDGLALCEAVWGPDGHLTDYQALEVNRAHAELTNASREQMLTQRVSTIAPPVDPRWFETAEKVLKTGVMHTFDVRSGATGRWLNIRVSRVSDTLFQQTFVDISDRYRLEEQRSALLKEMNHRVMNNFQMVASLLHLGASRADPVGSNQMKAAENRIQVLAKLHSLLSYTDSDAEVNAGSYLKDICEHLESTLERPEAVSIRCEADAIPMPTDQVVPLGLIVTELVTNAAKYAYPAPMSGTIRVSLSSEPCGWRLTIEDDGAGFEGVKHKATGRLGTTLVRRFVQQIGAELTTASEDGVKHRIEFRAKV